jgi:hypothetical protein
MGGRNGEVATFAALGDEGSCVRVERHGYNDTDVNTYDKIMIIGDKVELWCAPHVEFESWMMKRNSRWAVCACETYVPRLRPYRHPVLVDSIQKQYELIGK